MTMIPKPFEACIQIDDTDCMVTVRVLSYTPAFAGSSIEPPHDQHVEYEVTAIRLDYEGSESVPLTGPIADLIFTCCDFRVLIASRRLGKPTSHRRIEP